MFKCSNTRPAGILFLRPILNFAPRGKLWPQGWSYPLGVKFFVRPSILLNSRECSPLGVNEGVNISPRRQISPLGARGKVKNGPLTGHTSQLLLLLLREQKWKRFLNFTKCALHIITLPEHLVSRFRWCRLKFLLLTIHRLISSRRKNFGKMLKACALSVTWFKPIPFC
jgi:hypothetical protein